MSNCAGCNQTPATCPDDDSEPCQTNPDTTPVDYGDLNPGCGDDCCGKLEVPDGVYTSLTIKGGCITGVGIREEPAYTPPLCCPSCGEPGSPGGDVVLSTDNCNLLRSVGGALLVKPVFSTSGNVTVTGCGTASSPYVLNGPTGGGLSSLCVQNGSPDALTIAGNGTSTDCLIISHKEKSAIDTPWIKTDVFGHVIQFTPQAAPVPGTLPPIIIDPVTGYITTQGYTGNITTKYGTATYQAGVLQSWTPSAGVVTPFQFTTVDGRKITVNAFGDIIANEPA